MRFLMLTKSLRGILILSFLLVGSSLRAQSVTTNPSATLFTVGTKAVSIDEFTYLYRKNHPADKPGEYTAEKVEEYLDLFIKFKLKVEEARNRKMDTTAAFVKEFATYREELRKPYLPDAGLIDSLCELTYSRLQEEIRASHILINLKPDAAPSDTVKAYEKIKALRDRIVQGEDFGALAVSYSQDPSARLNKGDLGYFTAMQMVFPFENAAYSTPVGEVSRPFRTDFGYHIVQVTDRKPARGEVEVSHIMLRTGDGYDNEKAKNTIFDVYDRLQKGMSWQELCSEFSDDASSKDKGGRLRAFGVGAMSMAGAPEFEEIAFNLKQPGDISDPFQTRFGWHIIRLEANIPLPSYETMAPSLKNRVSRDGRAQLSKTKIQLRLRKEFGFSENENTKQSVMALADSALSTGTWKPKIPNLSESILFSMQSHPYRVGDFIEFAIRHQKPNSLEPGYYLSTLYDEYVNHVQGLAFEEKIRKDHPDYAWLINEYYEGILLFEIMEREVWSKASADTTGQREYYERHANAYMAEDRVRADIFSSSTDLGGLKTLIEKRDSASIQQFVAKNKVRHERGAFEKADRPVLSKINWAPGVHLSENNGMHYLVKVDNLLPPGRKTYEEARAAVISDYQNELEHSWIDQLKKQYPVKVSRKVKKQMERELVKKK